MFQRLALAGHQVAKQFKFLWRQSHRAPADQHFSALEINFQIIRNIRWDRLRGRGPSQRRANARKQFLHAEGLNDVVVGSGIQSEHFIVLGIADRQHDDSDVRLIADFAASFEAAHARHLTSSRTSSGRSLRIISRASSPVLASTTEYPLLDSVVRIARRICGSSSTTRIVDVLIVVPPFP